jgi:hypothetical protein
MGEMRERMLRGELSIAADEENAALCARTQALLERYIATPHGAAQRRDELPTTSGSAVARSSARA